MAVSPVELRVWSQGTWRASSGPAVLPERHVLGQDLLRLLHAGPLALQELGDRPAQGGVGDGVGGIGRHRPVAARELVLALRAGLDALQAAGDGELDGLM